MAVGLILTALDRSRASCPRPGSRRRGPDYSAEPKSRSKGLFTPFAARAHQVSRGRGAQDF
eukprot:scaffold18850_cov64-Phaeocystis_antarctica.AAC.1